MTIKRLHTDRSCLTQNIVRIPVLRVGFHLKFDIRERERISIIREARTVDSFTPQIRPVAALFRSRTSSRCPRGCSCA